MAEPMDVPGAARGSVPSGRPARTAPDAGHPPGCGRGSTRLHEGPQRKISGRRAVARIEPEVARAIRPGSDCRTKPGVSRLVSGLSKRAPEDGGAHQHSLRLYDISPHHP